jgi:hypothetical protein
VRQFIAAFNCGIYSAPEVREFREMNFAKQGGNKFPHSKDASHQEKELRSSAA